MSLGALVGGQFDTIGVAQDSRVAFDGPLIQVCPQHAQTIGMALHELATNSLKYGALSDPAGRLTVSWDSLAPEHWRIEWREHVSREVTPPERKGFGHTLILDMVERAVGGEVHMEFGPSGLVWALEVRVTPPAAGPVSQATRIARA